jgi:DNA polymerase elongation subunit (family B)
MNKPQVRLYDYNVYDKDNKKDREDDDDENKWEGNNKQFTIQMFGYDEKGNDYSVTVSDYNPFFFVKINKFKVDSNVKHAILADIQQKLGGYYKKDLVLNDCKILKRQILYGFDNGKEYPFLVLKFNNQKAMKKAMNAWYEVDKATNKRKLREKGMYSGGAKCYLELYEGKLPPLLRYFHMEEILPAGWITVKNKVRHLTLYEKKTNCKYEFETSCKNIIAMKDKETQVPLKVCSFDIEASSSHGDFPLAKKHYRKLIGELIEYWTKNKKEIKSLDINQKRDIFKKIFLKAYGFNVKIDADISKIFIIKKNMTLDWINDKLNKVLDSTIGTLVKNLSRVTAWQRMKGVSRTGIEGDAVEVDEDSFIPVEPWIPSKVYGGGLKRQSNIIQVLDSDLDGSKKLDFLNRALEWRTGKLDENGYPLRDHEFFPNGPLPKVKGDRVTFIGSTFMRLGEDNQYLNHMVVLNDCDDIPEVPNSVIETYKTEKGLLMGWAKMIKRENPEIILGYNIFGFDWKFMLHRCEELGCKDGFLSILSKNKEKSLVKKSVTKVASGTYDLTYVKMNGRLQIDLYAYFKKTVNLSSYKLDTVSSFYFGDTVNKHEMIENGLRIYSSNLMGLKQYDYIKLEIINHSTSEYNNGEKFQVMIMNKEEKYFEIRMENPNTFEPEKGKIRWCLAKDDVSPQDIFRLTDEGPKGRAKVAKYCYQDCNLVHNLFIKNQIYTEMSEMANLCSVPIDFIAMRGQGIKLLSYIAKKCREKKTLMPVKEKGDLEEGYEGAIVLPPKCAFYENNPVAVNDYSSLYPSSMISENISHDSKVWSKEYDLEDNELQIIGVQDSSGNFIYDHLKGFKYVDVRYDTYEYRRKNPKAKAEKVKVGYKICRFAQFPNNEKAIMPAVLQELLAQRKVYKKQKKIAKTPFLTQLYDKRQLATKVVANSLYGQCGAKTSSFYEIDIAASTTAIGRKLLMYAREIVEGCYKDTICKTKNWGEVRTNAEYIYGDTDSVFFSFNLKELDGTPILGKKALEITIELAVEAGELATMWLKAPHDLEYEKTFDPFLLLSKKRYVGMLHEFDINKGKRKEMGIVLKRRDNANCVKDIYGGVVDILMKTHNVIDAVRFTKKYLNNMVKGRVSLDKLIITKKLNAFYKNPLSIAHKVLADRMAKRDPGSKPSVGSRMPFAYIKTKKKTKLQGDKIESPEYIKKNELKLDYEFYITNQIMKPLLQLFGLVLEKIPQFKGKLPSYQRKVRTLDRKLERGGLTIDKHKNKITKIRDGFVKELIFDKSLGKKQQKTIHEALACYFEK